MSTVQPRVIVHLDKHGVSHLKFPWAPLLVSPLLHLLGRLLQVSSYDTYLIVLVISEFIDR